MGLSGLVNIEFAAIFRLMTSGLVQLTSKFDISQYIPAAAPVASFVLVASCKWISTKSKQVKPQDVEKDVPLE